MKAQIVSGEVLPQFEVTGIYCCSSDSAILEGFWAADVKEKREVPWALTSEAACLPKPSC